MNPGKIRTPMKVYQVLKQNLRRKQAILIFNRKVLNRTIYCGASRHQNAHKKFSGTKSPLPCISFWKLDGIVSSAFRFPPSNPILLNSFFWEKQKKKTFIPTNIVSKNLNLIVTQYQFTAWTYLSTEATRFYFVIFPGRSLS